MIGERRQKKPAEPKSRKGLLLRKISPVAHAIAQVAVLAGVSGEVAALLTGDSRFLTNKPGGCASLTDTATSVTHGDEGESKTWEDGKKMGVEYSDPISMEAAASQDGELSSLMKEVAERVSATRQKRRRKKE